MRQSWEVWELTTRNAAAKAGAQPQPRVCDAPGGLLHDAELLTKDIRGEIKRVRENVARIGRLVVNGQLREAPIDVQEAIHEECDQALDTLRRLTS